MKLYAFLNSLVNKKFAAGNKRHVFAVNIGYANGYVAVPPEHPLYGIDYYIVNEYISIHGGLTFAARVDELKRDGWGDNIEGINIAKFDDLPEDYWIFGFDTMHFNDGAHHDREWCINETTYLMEQLENFK